MNLANVLSLGAVQKDEEEEMEIYVMKGLGNKIQLRAETLVDHLRLSQWRMTHDAARCRTILPSKGESSILFRNVLNEREKCPGAFCPEI